MKYIIPAAIAIGVGLVTLVTYFFEGADILNLRLVLTNWAVILGGLAVLVGVLNLLLVHARRVQSQARGWVYSLVTIAAALFMILVGSGEGLRSGISPLYEETSVTRVLFSGVVVASQAALASLVMFFLVLAAMRMMRSRPNLWSAGFLAAVLITLIGWMPFGSMSTVNRIRDWLISVPASAGARGIILGVALGTLTVGIRVLTGVERPYKD